MDLDWDEIFDSIVMGFLVLLTFWLIPIILLGRLAYLIMPKEK
jgi:hypothetical protein